MDQSEISEKYGMPTANEKDCLFCEYSGYMVKDEPGIAQCVECKKVIPI